MKAIIVPARSFTSTSHSGATDVGITLRVPDISLPPLAQLGAHEDYPRPRWAHTSVAMKETYQKKDS